MFLCVFFSGGGGGGGVRFPYRPSGGLRDLSSEPNTGGFAVLLIELPCRILG